MDAAAPRNSAKWFFFSRDGLYCGHSNWEEILVSVYCQSISRFHRYDQKQSDTSVQEKCDTLNSCIAFQKKNEPEWKAFNLTSNIQLGPAAGKFVGASISLRYTAKLQPSSLETRCRFRSTSPASAFLLTPLACLLRTLRFRCWSSPCSKGSPPPSCPRHLPRQTLLLQWKSVVRRRGKPETAQRCR